MPVDDDLFEICRKIMRENRSEAEWAEMESGDMFQRGRYNGGFDADDMFFAFSFDDESKVQWSLSLTLDDVGQIVRREKIDVEIDRWNDLYDALERDV